jgi:hypothetical protein
LHFALHFALHFICLALYPPGAYTFTLSDNTDNNCHIMKKFLIALLTTALLAIFTGCTTKTSKDTSIPWNRPASWEGGIPGMGNPGEQR